MDDDDAGGLRGLRLKWRKTSDKVGVDMSNASFQSDADVVVSSVAAGDIDNALDLNHPVGDHDFLDGAGFGFEPSHSRMRSKGSRFTLRVWGRGCVRSTLRSRAQPSATVRNRPQPSATVRSEDRMTVPMGSFTEVVLFGGFRRLAASFRVADVALRDIQTVLQRVASRFAWQAQYFWDVFRRCVAVFVAGAALWACPSSFFVAGAAL